MGVSEQGMPKRLQFPQDESLSGTELAITFLSLSLSSDYVFI